MEEIKDKTEEATAAENQTAVEQQPTENNPQEDAKTKVYENALRKIFGLSAEEELGDVDRRITDLEQKNENIMQAAKSSIITTNINAMQGYDTKLLRKVIDLSGVEVDENSNITGLDAAIKTAETEYPAVLLPKERKTLYVPVNPPTDFNSRTSYEVQHRYTTRKSRIAAFQLTHLIRGATGQRYPQTPFGKYFNSRTSYEVQPEKLC